MNQAGLRTIALIIPAAGSGTRMNRDLPKPFIEVAGKPILEHTIRRFLEVEGLRRLVVATSGDYVEKTRAILESVAGDRLAVDVIEGGSERQHSIHNALERVGDEQLTIVHDAVRPFVSEAHIEACCQAAEEVGGAVLGVPAKDTIKKVDQEGRIVDTPSRQYLWQAQTPQVFRTDILKTAYEKARQSGMVGTDDASLVERLGQPIKMIEGDRSNFKITYPLDLRLARLLLQENQD